MNKFIGQSLAAFRSYYGLTKTALAKKLEVDSKLITLLEDGEQEPSTEVLSRYGSTFHVFMNDFHELAIALERSVGKVKNGQIHKNDVNNAVRTVKDSHDLTKAVLQRELHLLAFK